MDHELDINPSMVIQSSLALVMAITVSDAIKTAVERANTANPTYSLHNRVIAMILVIVIVLMFAIKYSKRSKNKQPEASNVPAGVSSTATG